MIRAFFVHLFVSALVCACTVYLYDRHVVGPSMQIGVVDLAAVYNAKESEFTKALTSSHTESERDAIQADARRFAERLPIALNRLPAMCKCTVLLKSAVVGAARPGPDLTALLRSELGLTQ